MLDKILLQNDLLDFDPLALVLCHKLVMHLLLLLNGVEIVDDHPHEEIEDKLASNYHECHKVEEVVKRVVSLGLHVLAHNIYAIVHH